MLHELRVHVISQLFEVILLHFLIDVGHVQVCAPQGWAAVTTWQCQGPPPPQESGLWWWELA